MRFTAILIFVVGLLPSDSLSQVREVRISTVLAKSVIDPYWASIVKKGFHKHRKYHLAISLNRNKSPSVAFATAVANMSFFLEGIPKGYAVHDNKLIFIFDLKSQPRFDSVAFKGFYEQFRDSLFLDVTPNGKQNNSFNGWIDEVECWRIQIENDTVTRNSTSTFPTASITRSYKYDEDGNLIYKDGIPDYTGWPQYGPSWNGVVPREFVLSTTNVPEDSLHTILTSVGGRVKNVGATLVVNEKGRIIEAKVVGIVHEPTRRTVEEALLQIRGWSPARKKGKPIKVRVRVSL